VDAAAVAVTGVEDATTSGDRERREVLVLQADGSPGRSSIAALEDAVEEGGCVDGVGWAKRECRYGLALESGAPPGSSTVRASFNAADNLVACVDDLRVVRVGRYCVRNDAHKSPVRAPVCALERLGVLSGGVNDLRVSGVKRHRADPLAVKPNLLPDQPAI